MVIYFGGNAVSTKKRIMALDVGDVRIGVALSDQLWITAQPYSTIERQGKSVLALIEIIKEKEVGTVVVGIPYELSGAFGAQAKKVQDFTTELHEACRRRKELQQVNFIFCDERLTTRQAQRVLIGSKLKNRENSAALDQIAATIILDSYLSSLGGSSVMSEQIAV